MKYTIKFNNNDGYDTFMASSYIDMQSVSIEGCRLSPPTIFVIVTDSYVAKMIGELPHVESISADNPDEEAFAASGQTE